jgi:DNA-binding response OmpR family regulator
MSERARILIVDDEEDLRFILSEELSQAGYTVLTAASGEEALIKLQEETIDLVLLDLEMGGMGGLQVMAEVGEQSLSPAVIVLTAHASLDSAIGAIRLGGCDYLKKPCRTAELLASVEKGLAKRREALRRQEMIHLIEETARQLRTPSPPATGPVAGPRFLEERGLLLDREQEIVTRDGEALSLTPSEFRLLACLMGHADRPVSYGELAVALHGEGGEWEAGEGRQAVSTHLWRLRRKLGHGPNGGPYIVNVRGRGYKFVGDK